jgi:hypothetical protein
MMREVWEAVQELHREDKANGVTGRRPTLLVMDELANLAPDPIYPSMVAQCADQGLLVCAGVQDLGQVERHFGSEAKTFLTVHREVLMFPGVRNVETLRAISELLGNRWERRANSGDSLSHGRDVSIGFNNSETDHRIPFLDIGELSAGLPGDPKAVLSLSPGRGGLYIWPSPVWAAHPWPHVLVANLELQRDATMIGPDGTEYPVVEMPVPELDRLDAQGRTALSLDLYDRFLVVKDTYRRARADRLAQALDDTTTQESETGRDD